MKYIQPLLLFPLLATLGACQMVSDDDLAKRTDTLSDADGDGFISTEYGGEDCDDDNDAINPDSTETPYDGVDDDCSGADLTDVDGDGYDAEAVGGGDCDDDNDAINPDSDEVCDEVDNDCDDDIDEDAIDATTWYEDDDDDSFGDPDSRRVECDAPSGYVTDNTDCDDDSEDSYPGAIETLGDDLDSDCNGDDDGFEFYEIISEEDVLQGPVLTRAGDWMDERIRIAWTTDQCERDGSTEHNCVFVETRTSSMIHTPSEDRAVVSNTDDLGIEVNGFDFVSNETHWGWARSLMTHGGMKMELGGHNIATDETDTFSFGALPGSTEEWTDFDAGLSPAGYFGAVACSDAHLGSPGTLAVRLDLADLADHSMTWSYRDSLDTTYNVCAWDPYWGYYHLLNTTPPVYTWHWWQFLSYDTLTQTDTSSSAAPIVDMEMKTDNDYFGRLYSVDTELYPSGSDIYLSFLEFDTGVWFFLGFDLIARPTEVDLAIAQDAKVLGCSMTEDGIPLLLLIDPLSSDELMVNVIPNSDLEDVEDCSVAINQDEQALVVYRSGGVLYEGRFALP